MKSREVPSSVPSEILELYRILTQDLHLGDKTNIQRRNRMFLDRLKATKAYGRNQDFRAMVDHLSHYHDWQYEEVSA